VSVAAAAGGLLVLERGGAGDPTAEGEALLVAVNAGTDAAVATLHVPRLAGARLVALQVPGLASPAPVDVDATGSGRIEIGARSGAILVPALSSGGRA
jgi:hypothetical protein